MFSIPELTFNQDKCDEILYDFIFTLLHFLNFIFSISFSLFYIFSISFSLFYIFTLLHFHSFTFSQFIFSFCVQCVD